MARQLTPQQANRTEFPTLFAIAMDYLPIQGTSVPCERVFSSAKETDTAKRNKISPALMESLQLLKFLFKKDRLDFMKGWAVKEEDLIGVPKPVRDPLSTLLLGDHDAALDDVLRGLSIYDENHDENFDEEAHEDLDEDLDEDMDEDTDG